MGKRASKTPFSLSGSLSNFSNFYWCFEFKLLLFSVIRGTLLNPFWVLWVRSPWSSLVNPTFPYFLGASFEVSCWTSTCNSTNWWTHSELHWDIFKIHWDIFLCVMILFDNFRPYSTNGMIRRSVYTASSTKPAKKIIKKKGLTDR